MDPLRQPLLHHLGLIDWQLRRPALLRGRQRHDEAAAPAFAHAAPRLWVLGSPPAWLGDFCLALGLAREAWLPLAEPAEIAADDWVLCLGESCPPLPGRQLHCLDPRRGDAKRALWRQVCQHA